MSAVLSVPPTADFAPVRYRPTQAIANRAHAVDRPFPYLVTGTGGLAGERFIRHGMGYRPFEVLESIQPIADAPYVKLMEQVRAGFGRTMSRLPEVFGVSRQTLYNWLDGETPKPAHQERLRQLAQAAQIFIDLGIKPTVPMLDRTVAQGKTLLQLLAAGGDGKESAKKLVRIIQRGSDASAQLDRLLAGRKAPVKAADLGTPAWDESA